MGNRRWKDFYCPCLVTDRTLDVGKVLFLCFKLEWNVPDQTCKGFCPIPSSPLPFIPWTNTNPYKITCWGCCLAEWDDPNEEVWRSEPKHQDMLIAGDFPNVLRRRESSILWVSEGWFSSTRAHLDLEIVIPCRGDQVLHVQGGRMSWHILPKSSGPQPSSLGTKLGLCPGMWH